MRAAMLLAAVLLLQNTLPDGLSPYRPSISDLAWLEGTWQGKVGGRDFEARYSGTEGGLILSASKYSAHGKPAGFEFERFEDKDGTVVLTPYPDGKSSVSFKLTSYDGKARRAVFENPAHDFPTRISYQRVTESGLAILVSGPGKDGKEKVIRYELTRVGE